MLALQTTAGYAAVARALARRRGVQRMPADFATTAAVNLKPGLEAG